ncbi:MAG: hypothetical protein ABEI52_10190, partial [Halobacteriaceae archaeon]
DIETISPKVDSTRDVDFLNSRDFEVVAVGVGTRPEPGAPVDVDVLWRNHVGPEGEYELLKEVIYWLVEHHFQELLTYNGVSFDIRHLLGRAHIVGEEVGDLSLQEAMHATLQRGRHRDLYHDIVREHGRMSLEDAVETLGGERPPSVQWDGTVVESSDIPQLAEQLLAHRDGLSDIPDDRAVQLEDTLNTYITTDIYPLFDLRDALEDGDDDSDEVTF